MDQMPIVNVAAMMSHSILFISQKEKRATAILALALLWVFLL